jgi:hypothetical protein
VIAGNRRQCGCCRCCCRRGTAGRWVRIACIRGTRSWQTSKIRYQAVATPNRHSERPVKPPGIFDDSSIRDLHGRIWRPTHHGPSRMTQNRHVHRPARMEHQPTPGQRFPSRCTVYPADSADTTRNIQFTGLVSAGRVLVWAAQEGPGEPWALPSAILRVGWVPARLNPAHGAKPGKAVSQRLSS